MSCIRFDDEKIESRDEILLRSLLKFYKENPQHLKDLSAISSQQTLISLREMDFVVTKYSKINKDLYPLYLEYKAQLRGHSKKQLDPFCRVGDRKKDPTRMGRIFIDFDTKTPIFINNTEDEIEYKKRTDGVVTTVCQLNFFRWAINNKIIEYCFNNKENIVNAMNAEANIRKNKKSIKKNSKDSKEDSKDSKDSKQSKVIIHFPE